MRKGNRIRRALTDSAAGGINAADILLHDNFCGERNRRTE